MVFRASPIDDTKNFRVKDYQTGNQTNKVLKAAPALTTQRYYITDIIVCGKADVDLKLVSDPSGIPADLTPLLFFGSRGGMSYPLKTPIAVGLGKGFGYTSICADFHSVMVVGYIAD